jgi:tetratricopeptide (TPR) repeat protein
MKRDVITSVLATLFGLTLFAAPFLSAAQAQDFEQLRRWCFEDSTDDQTIQGCAAVISAGIQSGDDLADAYDRQAYSYNAKGQYDKAIADYDHAIALGDKFPSAFRGRGNAHYAKAEYDRAIADFQEAIRRGPNDADAYYDVGNAFRAKGSVVSALRAYDRAIELAPDFAAAFDNRGSLWI